MHFIYALLILLTITTLSGLTIFVCYYTILSIVKIRGDIKATKEKNLVLRYKKRLILKRLYGQIQEEGIDIQARRENKATYIKSFNIPVE